MSGAPFDGAHRWHLASNGHHHDCFPRLPDGVLSDDHGEQDDR